MKSHDLIRKLYGGSVGSRLHVAKKMYDERGKDLLQEKKIVLDLEELQGSLELLSQQMDKMKMAQICTTCANSSRGGCCSCYMAGETDAIQLLINMLVGITVEVVRNDNVECCYLGEKGCIFVFKPFFCLNYNCKKINGEEKSEDLLQLQKLTGQFLQKQYRLENRVFEKIERVNFS